MIPPPPPYPNFSEIIFLGYPYPPEPVIKLIPLPIYGNACNKNIKR
jgi:hypothetical protein